MTTTVFKYELALDALDALNRGPLPLSIEVGAEPLCVAEQCGRVCLWARLDSRIEKKDRLVWLVAVE